MSDEIELPSLVVTTGKSEFRLRCHAAAWAADYGGSIRINRRHSQDYPGLLLLSATGPDTAAKSVRATLYQPDVAAEFVPHLGGATERMVRAHGTRFWPIPITLTTGRRSATWTKTAVARMVVSWP